MPLLEYIHFVVNLGSFLVHPRGIRLLDEILQVHFLELLSPRSLYDCGYSILHLLLIVLLLDVIPDLILAGCMTPCVHSERRVRLVVGLLHVDGCPQ